MFIEELKQKADSCRNESNDCEMVDAIVATIESQEQRIAELELRVGENTHHGTFPSGLETKPMHDEAVALQNAKNKAGVEKRDAIVD